MNALKKAGNFGILRYRGGSGAFKRHSFDVLGSYTGRTAFHDTPEQDADDL